jgi:hypothetical protein
MGRELESHGARACWLIACPSTGHRNSKLPSSGLPARSSAPHRHAGPADIRPGRQRSHQGFAKNQKARRENSPSTTARSPTSRFVFSEPTSTASPMVSRPTTSPLFIDGISHQTWVDPSPRSRSEAPHPTRPIARSEAGTPAPIGPDRESNVAHPKIFWSSYGGQSCILLTHAGPSIFNGQPLPCPLLREERTGSGKEAISAFVKGFG